MSAREWLVTSEPAAPAALRARLESVLAEVADPAAPPADVFLAAGEALVARLLADGRTSRDAALDLLTADALLTYAFEAAASEPGGLPGRARAAMVRMAALAAEAR